MANDSVLVDHERGPIRESVPCVQNSVFFADRSLKIAKQGKRDADLFGESVIGRNTVNADSEYLGACLLEFGLIRLIRLQLLCSARGEGKNVECQDNVFLPAN